MANQVALVSGLGCNNTSLPNGAVGQVLVIGADGPEWGAGGGGGGVDLCSLSAADAACVALAVRGDLVMDAFGVDLGYLLPL